MPPKRKTGAAKKSSASSRRVAIATKPADPLELTSLGPPARFDSKYRCMRFCYEPVNCEVVAHLRETGAPGGGYGGEVRLRARVPAAGGQLHVVSRQPHPPNWWFATAFGSGKILEVEVDETPYIILGQITTSDCRLRVWDGDRKIQNIEFTAKNDIPYILLAPGSGNDGVLAVLTEMGKEHVHIEFNDILPKELRATHAWTLSLSREEGSNYAFHPWGVVQEGPTQYLIFSGKDYAKETKGLYCAALHMNRDTCTSTRIGPMSKLVDSDSEQVVQCGLGNNLFAVVESDPYDYALDTHVKIYRISAAADRGECVAIWRPKAIDGLVGLPLVNDVAWRPPGVVVVEWHPKGNDRITFFEQIWVRHVPWAVAAREELVPAGFRAGVRTLAWLRWHRDQAQNGGGAAVRTLLAWASGRRSHSKSLSTV